ncbi:phage resistance protein [Enterococcus asini]|uniref:phage resistance protein n=1 Tax=Enterococcus asini TaxID=57732 RepID=UPI00288DB695|nr:phage resistance protein [Enterococcus asini]MDT2743918.1 phage resistance protein [Enterococcus asini]
MTKIKLMGVSKASELYREFQKIRLNVDSVDTPHLSQIKEIIKRVHFADIANNQQALNNTGDVFYKEYERDEGKTFQDVTLSYTIEAKKTGIVYGLFHTVKDKEGTKRTEFKYAKFSNYARFLADVTSRKVIYSKELKRFVRVTPHAYEVIDELAFSLDYPVENNRKIPDFLSVIEEIYAHTVRVPTHDYTINPFCFAGSDWVYDCKSLTMEHRTPEDKELFFQYYDVPHAELNLKTVENFLAMVADGSKSLNNLRLLHAYVLLRKLELVPPEYFFILKDFGRTGKGLVMTTFDGLFKVNKVNFDALTGGGFEANNEWFKFYNTDLAHANETGEIDKKNMRILRKISTCEPVTGREIGKDSVKFNIRAVLVLDTNEDVNIGEITANRARTVKIAFKDRPSDETSEERHAVFEPYWDFVAPNNQQSIAASLSFLINSLNYLKSLNGVFRFDDVTLRTYFSADELTEPQRVAVVVIDRDGFILAGDDTLRRAIEEEYGSLRYARAKQDFVNVGVKINQSRWIEGQAFRVHEVGNEELFQQIVELINNSSIKG